MTEQRAAYAVAGEGRASPILLPGYDCRCARCGREWVARCECPHQEARGTDAPVHVTGCAPPKRCPTCGVLSWWRPAGPQGFATLSEERRRELARQGGLKGGRRRGQGATRR